VRTDRAAGFVVVRLRTVPSSDELFHRFFWPHYPPDVRAQPDKFRDHDANPAGNQALVDQCRDAAEKFVRNAPVLLGCELGWTAEDVSRLSHEIDRAKRDAWIAASEASDPGNVLFNAVVHAALYVGEVATRAHGGRWTLRRPLWESVVALTSEIRAARAFAPFHWLLKHLSDDEIDRGTLADRFQIHVAFPSTDPSALPVLTTRTSLPSLRAPTYDTWVKFLQTHVPSLRDLGVGFPSPSEFTHRAFARLDVHSLHGGRVLALHGMSPATSERPAWVEVSWLTAHGFHHADAFPCDPTPPYFARVLGDEALEVTFAWEGRPRTHRLTLRGHA